MQATNLVMIEFWNPSLHMPPITQFWDLEAISRLVSGFLDLYILLMIYQPSRGQLVLVSSNANRSATKQIMKPLVDAANSIGADSNVTEVSSFYDWFQEYVIAPGGVQDVSMLLDLSIGTMICI
jgi:hypothetical protein